MEQDSEPRTSTCPTASTFTTSTAPPRRRRKPPNPWVMLWILQREERGCYRTLLADLTQTDLLGYQNFLRMPPAFFYLIEEHINHRIKKSVTNFKKPIEVELKLAIMMRHLATGETYTSLWYHWLVGQTAISKFVPQVCRAILEFQEEYLSCLTDPEDWKKVEKLRTR